MSLLLPKEMILPFVKFFLLCISQIGVLFFPFSYILCGFFLPMGYSLWDKKLRYRFLKFLGIYSITILFFIPLVWIENRFFGYDISHTYFLLSLYVRSFLALTCLGIYKKHSSFLEFFYVLETLHIPPLFLSATLFILLFLRNLIFTIKHYQIAWKLRIHSPSYFFRIKIFCTLVKNLIVFSFLSLEDIHSMVVLRKLNRPIPFALLYLSEVQYKKKNLQTKRFFK